MSGKNFSAAEGDKPGSKKASAGQSVSQRQTLSVEDAGEILGLSRRRCLRAGEGRQPSDNPPRQASSRSKGRTR